MLVGRYEAEGNWPSILAESFLGEARGALRFLIDTGASGTLLNIEDARRLGADSLWSATSGSIQLLEGEIAAQFVAATFVFVGDDGRRYAFDRTVGVFGSTESEFFPSVLGRDILNCWRLTLDGVAQAVLAEVLDCDFQFDP